MSFTGNLGSPSVTGGSGIYNAYPGQSIGQMENDALSLHNQIKDRELQDFKDKATFMADLTLRQNRLQQIYGDNQPGAGEQQQEGAQGGGQTTKVMQDPNQITPYQKGELGIRQQGVDVEKQRLAQQGVLGQEAQTTKAAQEALNQQKSNQQFEIAKQKVAETEEKIKQAGADFDKRLNAMNDHMRAMEDLKKAEEERRKSEDATRNAQFKEVQDRAKKAQDDLNAYRNKVEADKMAPSIQQRSISPDQSTQTTTTMKGKVLVTGKDGKGYFIDPKDKADWDKNHAPEQDQQDQNQDEE